MADTHPKDGAKKGSAAMIANVLAIAGSLILIVIIIWGLIHLISLSGGWFSSLFDGDTENIAVTAPTEVTSGTPFNVSWTHESAETGMYALMYPCIEGLRFSTPGPSGAQITMPCGAAFGVGSARADVSITPILTGTSSKTTPLSVLFIPSSTSSTPVEGTVTLSVKPKPSEPDVPEPETPEPETPVQPKPASGPADLAVTIASASLDQYGNGVVTFNISNVGNGSSGGYTFTAQLPTAQPYTYNSPVQASLAPGSYIVNTLRFSGGIPGTVHVVVDPLNAVRESNEGNNTALRTIGGTYPQQYNNQYQPAYYDMYNYPYTY